MLRLALLALAAVVTVLVVVALLPERTRVVPESVIVLESARLTLYPEADPEAVWRFAAPEARYVPERRETTLMRLEDGARIERGEVDFTVRSDEVVIDSNDNLRGQEIFAHLLASDDCLTMLAEGEAPVLIDQRAGRFIVPVMKVQGPSWGDASVFPSVRASFDLAEFNAGGPGTNTVTEFLTDPDETRSTPCVDF